jgi:preprotein translocase SecE subunit
VARNRKRAKDRRTRRPPQPGSSRSGGRSNIPGVLPGTPTVTDEPAPDLEPEDNGAPDPLEHATPDVELAESQLAVGRPAEPELGDEADEEEFELEVEESLEDADAGRGGGGYDRGGGGYDRGGGGYDRGDGSAASAGGGEVAVPGAAQVERRPGIFERLIGFLQGSWRELQRVQWPDRRQVMQATGVVIGFVIVAAAFLGLADLVSQKVVTFILK